MKDKIKGIVSDNKKKMTDLFYTIGAVVLMQGVLQLIIYPYINKTEGETVLGNIVFYMGIVFIIGQAIGMAFCSNRLVVRNKFETTNGDYNFLLKIFVPFGFVASAIFFYFYLNVIGLLLVSIIVALTILRYYSNVEFRLKLNFRMYFLFFAILTAGYLAGTVLYKFTGQWYWIFIVGEGAVLIFMLARKKIFAYEKRSENTRLLAMNILPLIFSYCLNDFINNTDKIILHTVIDADAVSLFFVISMIGKTLALLTGPINNITLSYLSVEKEALTRKRFFKMFGFYSLMGGAFYIFCCIATPLYVKWFYPNLFDKMDSLNLLINAGQILNFLGALAIILILASIGSKYHLYIQLIYAALYIPLAIILTQKFGLWGFSWAVLIANIVRTIELLLFAWTKLPRERGENNFIEESITIEEGYDE
ncbi:MAG: lipopolysaccharide biosynthesis protein [Anaerovoracaceae bacterium]